MKKKYFVGKLLSLDTFIDQCTIHFLKPEIKIEERHFTVHINNVNWEQKELFFFFTNLHCNAMCF